MSFSAIHDNPVMPFSAPTDITIEPSRSMPSYFLSTHMYTYDDYQHSRRESQSSANITPISTTQYFPTIYEHDIPSQNHSSHASGLPTDTRNTTIVPSWQAHGPHDKPPYSYATLIAHSILSSEQKRLPLSDIYQWISKTYPYYSLNDHGWQNSIRHNLSLNKSFVKRERSSKKGCYWAIQAGKEQAFIDKLVKRGTGIGKQQQFGVSKLLSKANELEKRMQNAPLLTTFRTTPLVSSKSASNSTKRKSVCIQQEFDWRLPVEPSEDEVQRDSDCDSGIDVGAERRSKKKQKQKEQQQKIAQEAKEALMLSATQSLTFPNSGPTRSTCISYPSIISATPAENPVPPTPTPLTSTALFFDMLSLSDTHGAGWSESATIDPSKLIQNESRDRSLHGYRINDEQCAYGLGASTADLLRSLEW